MFLEKRALASACKLTAAAVVAVAGSATAVVTAGAQDAPSGPALAVVGSQVTYDNVGVGQSAVKPLTVKSAGTEPVQVTRAGVIGRDGSDFAIVSDGCSGRTLAAGATCILGTRFRPTTDGTRIATVQVSGNTGCSVFFNLAGGGSRIEPAATRAVSCVPSSTTVTTTTPGTTTTVTSASGASTSSGGGAGSTASGSTASGSNAVSLPSARRCVSRRAFTINVRPKRTLRNVRVRVGTKTVKTLAVARRAFKARIDLTGLSRRRYAVTVTGTLPSGNTFRQVRNYVTCIARR